MESYSSNVIIPNDTPNNGPILMHYFIKSNSKPSKTSSGVTHILIQFNATQRPLLYIIGSRNLANIILWPYYHIESQSTRMTLAFIRRLQWSPFCNFLVIHGQILIYDSRWATFSLSLAQRQPKLEMYLCITKISIKHHFNICRWPNTVHKKYIADALLNWPSTAIQMYISLGL